MIELAPCRSDLFSAWMAGSLAILRQHRQQRLRN
jgi:hypothetical protein